MGVIKASNTPGTIRTFSMTDVEEAARGILLRARKQAEQLIEEAQSEAELIKEQARAEGSREGYAQGMTEGARQGTDAGRREAFAATTESLTQLIAALTVTARDFDAARSDLESEALREVVALAAAVARRVTKRQGLIDESVLAANLAEAMKVVVHATGVRIALHPSQRGALEAALPELRAEWPTLEHIDVVEDPAIAPGGCRVHTRGGRVDADLDSQLDRVIAELMPRA